LVTATGKNNVAHVKDGYIVWDDRRASSRISLKEI
jgi:hypothetical protein